ncbi:MAG: Lipoprotein-releasing system ATP-binding protein LolD [Ignavibacteriaceae bacterium]|jgi:lipoprotein-releasing system ATP-binding protein|nr:ABC transporter ATP-binding protein [Ignavibacteriales bacterium]MBV6422212.1 Lipoprotein-releasing system ATP-binding protein LolD [Ignavibacteriaceae bacterium]MEB2296251.1 ABC transporter ATP-binding protein [Ignavibacteria bacterium]GIK60989.1 MAG: lipoprotein-releasing system ATP-binding protein LolD [Ignavibacteriota bacterium]MCC7094631.1 ABC transporter ATP-binding protein [Ignavibacteriaceae bacterium]
MDNIILTAKNIYKSFQSTRRNKLEVLKGVSVEIEMKNITIIVGASGAGKSTLLHLLGGLDRPDSGEVIYDSENIFKYSEDQLAKFRNKNIGFVFQFHHLLPEFTAIENVILPQIIGGINFQDAKIKSAKLLETVGLTERIDHKPAELSGGEQQRVAFARALANDPKIIFADEPTGNLDSVNSEGIHALIRDLKSNLGITFVIVTHNPKLVNLADRLLEIKDGKILSKQ